MKTLLEQWRAALQIADRPDEYEVKELLARLGLRVPRGVRLPPGGPRECVPDFTGPFVAKVCTPEILHKTERQGVFLNLEPGNLATAVGALSHAFPEASILVEQMVAFQGPEMIAGGRQQQTDALIAGSRPGGRQHVIRHVPDV